MEASSTLEQEAQALKHLTEKRNRGAPKTKITFRKLDIGDFDRGYYELLANLTVTGDVTRERFEEQFNFISPATSHTYKIIVGIDDEKDKVVCNGTLILEKKFARNCATCGHIEDIVVHPDYGKQGIGGDLLTALSEMGKINNCYKLILDCAEKLEPFYGRQGYKYKGIQMAKI
ncbi:unnamed protein product [Moneuplotes crassus]|uniref:Glucosamine 6-phosphate N-acetyltransferase n=1 Tax=Euplotes crassus TaxID=5936 RepID=A0AAD2D659_EUPCR|nr:unnamed protein product [Moneuplotes crassus]